jgi:hypothetical protein
LLSPHAAAAAVAADDVASCPLPPFRRCAVVSAAVAISVAVAAVVARRPPQKLRACSMHPQVAATAAAAAVSIYPALCSWFLCRWSALCVAALVVFLAGAARLQELSMLAALIQKLYSCSSSGNGNICFSCCCCCPVPPSEAACLQLAFTFSSNGSSSRSIRTLMLSSLLLHLMSRLLLSLLLLMVLLVVYCVLSCCCCCCCCRCCRRCCVAVADFAAGFFAGGVLCVLQRSLFSSQEQRGCRSCLCSLQLFRSCTVVAAAAVATSFAVAAVVAPSPPRKLHACSLHPHLAATAAAAEASACPAFGGWFLALGLLWLFKRSLFCSQEQLCCWRKRE